MDAPVRPAHPFVLGMEEQPGLKGMKKRLKGDHKTAIKTRADEAADLFAQITELVSCSEEEAEADRQAALPRLQALFAAVRDFDARFSAKSGSASCWNSATLNTLPCGCCAARTAPPPRCAGASGRTMLP